MKQLLFLFSILFFHQETFSQSKRQFKVSYAELYATYDFLTKLSDSYPDNVYKTEYSKSRYNTEAYRKIINQLDTLKLDYNYYFEQYSPTMKNALSSTGIYQSGRLER